VFRSGSGAGAQPVLGAPSLGLPSLGDGSCPVRWNLLLQTRGGYLGSRVRGLLSSGATFPVAGVERHLDGADALLDHFDFSCGRDLSVPPPRTLALAAASGSRRGALLRRRL